MLSFELNQTSAALGINMGYIYIVLPLSGGLIVINCIENLVTCAQQKLSEDA
jgi:TRAP-type C4-dicarboxylate transport system permease small subunit